MAEQLRVERGVSVSLSFDNVWVWIGRVSAYRPDGSRASYVSRWGGEAATEADANAAADEWMRTKLVLQGHSVPGLGDLDSAEPTKEKP